MYLKHRLSEPVYIFYILDPGIIEISPRDKKKEQTKEPSATNTVLKDFSINVYFSFNFVTQFNFYDYSKSDYIWIIVLPKVRWYKNTNITHIK